MARMSIPTAGDVRLIAEFATDGEGQRRGRPQKLLDGEYDVIAYCD
jgi:hypothetical protein